MKKLLLVGLFLAGLVIGAMGGGLWASHRFAQFTVSKEVETASAAAFQAEWLALLRLGDIQGAIKDMENTMDIQIDAVAQWNEVNPPDEKTRAARDRWLVPVKVYHESYPVSGEDPARITALLATIPDRNIKKICKNGICRLDDVRLAKLPTSTNSP